MAFSWIRRRRAHPATEPAAKQAETAPSSGADVQPTDNVNINEDAAASLIHVRVEDGLLMTFGPLGDPVPPAVVKTVCASEADGMLQLPGGELVDHRRVVEILEIQQTGPLADHQNDRWIEAMLGVGGSYETTLDGLLSSEIVDTGPAARNQLKIETIGGQALRLRNAHPGDIHEAPLAQLKRDGKGQSIEAILAEAPGKKPTDGSVRARSAGSVDGSIALRGETIAVDLPGQRKVVLEKAPIVWDGKPKVDLAWADGRSTTLDDVFDRLQAETREAAATATSHIEPVTCPLLPANEPMAGLERATIVMVSGLPDDWSLSMGMKNDQGSWLLNPDDIDAVDVVMPGPSVSPASLTLKAIAVSGPDGSLEEQTRDIVCPARTIDGDRSSTPADPGLPAVANLGFLESEIASAAADALLLRGLSDGMTLSAGTYDPAIKGWILLPAQIENLSVTLVDGATDSVEIEVRAIHVGGDGNHHMKVIATRTIDFARTIP